MTLSLASYLQEQVMAAYRRLCLVYRRDGFRDINISWEFEVDVATGNVTATPSFGLNLLTEERRALEEDGIAEQTICTFGPLVRLIPQESTEQDDLLFDQLGIPLDLNICYVKAIDAARMREAMSRRFTIDEPTPVDLWLRGLPKFMNWSNIEGFRIGSDPTPRYQAAFFKKDGREWSIFSRTNTRSADAMGTVGVTWNLRHDPETGEYWADPVFRGYKVRTDNYDVDLQVLCKAMGIAEPRLYTPITSSLSAKA